MVIKFYLMIYEKDTGRFKNRPIFLETTLFLSPIVWFNRFFKNPYCQPSKPVEIVNIQRAYFQRYSGIPSSNQFFFDHRNSAGYQQIP